MSSYRSSNYMQWRGSSGAGGSSYSPASSTSSLASSTSTGGSSNKFSSSLTSSGLKSADSTPSRESSFTSGISSTGASSASGRLSRFSSLSSTRDTTSSTTSGNASSNYGSSNLSTSTKSSFGSSASSSLSKDKNSSLSSGYGLPSVSALSSKFTPSTETSSSSFRPSATSSYLRTTGTGGTSSAGRDTTPTKSRASTYGQDNSYSKKSTSESATTRNSDTGANSASTNLISKSSESSNTGAGLTTNYRPYSSRGLGTSSDISNFGPSAVSSALRTTARFGLRSGPAHAHYSSSLPTASTLKAAAALAEETKKEKELSKSVKKIDTNTGPVEWMSRGTCTTSDAEDSKKSMKYNGYDYDDNSEIRISEEEVPSFEPRVFSTRYEGVLKHKGVQTDEEPKQKLLPSAIPRPAISVTMYNPYNSSVARFTSSSTKNTPASQQQSNNDSQSTTSSKSGITLDAEDMKDVTNNDEESKSNSSSNLKLSSTINNNSYNKTPGTMTSGSDQSSRSSHQTINSKNVAESSSGNCNNGHETSTSGTTTTTNTTTNSTTENSMNKVSSLAAASQPSGLVITIANKEFRKSALNVGLDSKDAEAKFAKKQEELRLQKASTTTFTPIKTSVSSSPNLPAINNNSNDNQNINSINSTPSSLLNNLKRDPPRRPPTDPSKSSTSTIHQSRSISRIASTNNINDSNQQDAVVGNANGETSEPNVPPPSGLGGLAKMKSTKNVTQIRKLSTASSNASDSESSSSLSTTSALSKGSSIATKVKKKLLSNNSNSNLDNKGQGRKGSATSCSSAASSRSNSVERNAQNNNSNTSSNNNSISSSIKPVGNNNNITTKLEKGNNSVKSLASSPLKKPPSGSLSSASGVDKEIVKKDQTTTGLTGINNTEAKKSPSKILIPKKEAETNSQDSQSKENESPSNNSTSPLAEPTQTGFLLRTQGGEARPWVKRCQSGELPWWMKSNPDVPSILGRNPSRSIIRDVTSKDLTIHEEKQGCGDGKNESSSSELSDSESEMNDDNPDIESIRKSRPLGERTSPDGVEIPSAVYSPKSTLLGGHSANNLKLLLNDNKNDKDATGSCKRKDSLFIGDLTNIDDILGTVSPSLLAGSPSPAPGSNLDELCDAQRKLSLKDAADDESESEEESESESSSSSEIEDELDLATKKEEFTRELLSIGHKSHEDDSDASSDDDGSTGTSSSFEEVDPSSVKIPAPPPPQQKLDSPGLPDGPEVKNEKQRNSLTSIAASGLIPKSQREKLDDATLQLYKDGDCGTYLDLESSISEQQEEFDGFLNNRKNSIVLRAQLPVRVHAIIEKLLTADGRELRRALFSLKQIFQEDKDLVHEFVENGGLSCLIKVGSEADQNYQNYILRAIGQVMLYVDGMYGVMRHNETIQWLYSLTASKFRLVQKTALKLLLVFVDYVETNCLLLVQAVTAVDSNKGLEWWSNIMSLLREHDSNSGDTELLVYAMTLVNKVLNGIPDIDAYYDQVDALEEQGMATIIQSYMGKQCADLDLLKQFQIYELVLKHEDGEENNIVMQLDEAMRTKLLSRKSYGDADGQNKGRRKSRRHSTSTPPTTPNGTSAPAFPRRLSSADVTPKDSPYSSLSSSSSNGMTNGSPLIVNGHKDKSNNMELTPGLRRRRERADHQKNLLLEQLVNGTSMNGDCNGDLESPTSGSKKDILSLELQNNLKNSSSNSNLNGNANGSPAARPWMLPIYTKTHGTAASSTNIANGISKGEKENGDASESEKDMLQQMKRENTVKDLTQKLASQNLLASPAEENKSFIITGELSGVVSKAKEGLAKSKSRADMKPPQADTNANGTASNKGIQLEVKKSDNELHWDFLVNNLQRPLEICDLDFTDLKSSDDEDILAPDPSLMNCFGLPPPVPMANGNPPPPPPSVGKFGGAPPPPLNGLGSPLFGISLKTASSGGTATDTTKSTSGVKKTKKTVKLFWKEVRDDPITASKVEKVGCIWSEIQPIQLDTQKLEHLFESRAKDVINKKQSDVNKTKEIVVLDPKRSNAINIGMTKLPPPRTIKAAIMKMDSTIINREGIEKLLAMLPTEEERAKITEAQFANPETPLGSAEQFLLTLSSISELTARLKLWAFKLDYENLEREVAEPLMDLKTGIIALEKNKTFRYILATLLSIGNFLNGADAKGFQIEYLSKVPEVKDTVQKHSLLHHLCHTVNENYPDSTDLYSEIGPVTRASRVDFDEIGTNLIKMESDCKTSWDHLRVIAKHDGPTNLKLKLSEFLADCAERIIVLGMIHRRIVNRFRKFLLWLGVSAHQVTTTKPHVLFKIVSEFALEYRTTRERVIQQLQKKASHRERNKTRGKMITEQPQIMYKSKEDQEDADLREVLSKSTKTATEGEVVKGSLSWNRRQKSQPSNGSHPNTPTTTLYHNFQNNKSSTLNGHGTLNDGDDEILESLVKTATRTSDTRVANRERKRINGTRNFTTDRKSLRRTLRHGLTEEERSMLAAFMATGHSFYS